METEFEARQRFWRHALRNSIHSLKLCAAALEGCHGKDESLEVIDIFISAADDAIRVMDEFQATDSSSSNPA